MRVERIGIFQSAKTTRIGRDRIDAIVGKVNNKEITVYSSYTDNKLTSKLYYLQDNVGKWLKYKLLQFKDDKVIDKEIKERIV